MIKKEKLIEAGADKLADIILFLFSNCNKNFKKQIEILVAGINDDPKEIISIIKKQISSINRSSCFIDYYDSIELGKNLKQIRLRIVNDIFPKSQKDAFTLMLAFLDIHEKLLDRSDDSGGSISETFSDACHDLGTIAIHFSSQEAVDFVFEKFLKKGYSAYHKIIFDFKDILGKKGLLLLQKKFEKELGALQKKSLEIQKEKEEEAEKDKNKSSTLEKEPLMHLSMFFGKVMINNLGIYNNGKDDEKQNIKYRISDIKNGMKNIADALGNVDAFVKACSISSEVSINDILDIAQRMIAHWRADEALEWLKKINNLEKLHYESKPKFWELTIQALELKGDYSKAQEERIIWFNETLDTNVYGEILKYSTPELKKSFRSKVIDTAFEHQNVNMAFNFLLQAQEFEALSKFIYIKIGELNGRYYEILRPAAELLHEIDPLAATILYRKMIEPVLSSGQSKYYAYAAKDLLMCEALDPKISLWQKIQPHSAYFKEFSEKHKRKIAFWEEFKTAKQKQGTQEVKNQRKIKKKNTIEEIE
ncbi:MAG: hypothetical protein LBS83_03450 [Holosporales bacterium]|jgi:hypothetical protein|nr:hypothetical protein [Holosporales bacterium]